LRNEAPASPGLFSSAGAGPLVFGDTVWLDDDIAKVSYQASASPSAAGSGRAVVGEVIYYSDAGWMNTGFASTV
jgi:hypothetical protein